MVFLYTSLDGVWLTLSGSGDFSVNYLSPSATYRPIVADSFDPAQTLDVSSYIQNNFYIYTPYSYQWSRQLAGYLGLSTSGLQFNDIYANDLLSEAWHGALGWLSDALDQAKSAVHDPVHAVTGEFYVDFVDLTLVGPLPLF